MSLNRLYILSHQSGYLAYENYCVNLVDILCHYFQIRTIIYDNDSDIPSPLSPNDRYIFLNYITPRFINLFINDKHQHIYLINTEQSTRPLWTLILTHYIEMGIKIYDYDQYQAKTMFHSKYLPYQISSEEINYLNDLIINTPKCYHVAFCSVNKSKKRLGMYKQLENIGLKVIDVNGWDKRRDMSIASAKILINIHYDKEYQIFEHMRCDRWILSGMLVISEESVSDDILDCKDLMISAKYETMVEKVLNIITNYDEIYSQYSQKLSLKKDSIIQTRHLYCQQFIDDIVKS